MVHRYRCRHRSRHAALHLTHPPPTHSGGDVHVFDTNGDGQVTGADTAAAAVAGSRLGDREGVNDEVIVGFFGYLALYVDTSFCATTLARMCAAGRCCSAATAAAAATAVLLLLTSCACSFCSSESPVSLWLSCRSFIAACATGASSRGLPNQCWCRQVHVRRRRQASALGAGIVSLTRECRL